MLSDYRVVVEEKKVIVQVEEKGPELVLTVPGEVRVLEVATQGPPGPPGGVVGVLDGGEF